MKKIFSICFAVFFCFSPQFFAQIPTNVSVQISRAEDELRFDKTLKDLMKSGDAKVRTRAALASGRIGKEDAIPFLVNLLEADSDAKVRAAAVFAIGEIESTEGADAILKALQNTDNADEIRARAIEAAGKIAAANAKNEKARQLGAAILDALRFEENRGARANRDVVLLGITAILRAKPETGEIVAAKFLTDADARIRSDAANTLSRLRAKNANAALYTMLKTDKDAIARANAARALGSAEDKDAFDLLLGTALNDEDSRVRVSAIRSLASLKDAKAADKLIERGEILIINRKKPVFANPIEKNELLEIATTLGRILPNTNNERAVKFLIAFRTLDKVQSPETEIALARVAPAEYLTEVIHLPVLINSKKLDWQTLAAVSQGLGEFSALPDKCFDCPRQTAESVLRAFLAQKDLGLIVRAVPDLLRAFAAFKTDDLAEILRKQSVNSDVIVRATAAELLGEQTANKENVETLKKAFDSALSTDKEMNDAQLAILDALFNLDKKEAVPTLLIALDAPDYLVRKKAFDLLKDKDLQKDFPNIKTNLENAITKNRDEVLPYNPKTRTKLGQILNSQADYVRAVSRKSARAIVATEKGTFTIEFFPEDAPLTVDNFIKLAKANYFNGLTIHRVVPNFVVQDGDPRGDGNGGPGWEIRDEINEIPYERGAVGMALSGKDTGGSQWFVTHSPQPHLDGGYTVFGRVSETDMKIVDNLARGDKILSVKIIEGDLPQRTQGTQRNGKRKITDLEFSVFHFRFPFLCG